MPELTSTAALQEISRSASFVRTPRVRGSGWRSLRERKAAWRRSRTDRHAESTCSCRSCRRFGGGSTSRCRRPAERRRCADRFPAPRRPPRPVSPPASRCTRPNSRRGPIHRRRPAPDHSMLTDAWFDQALSACGASAASEVGSVGGVRSAVNSSSEKSVLGVVEVAENEVLGVASEGDRRAVGANHRPVASELPRCVAEPSRPDPSAAESPTRSHA